MNLKVKIVYQDDDIIAIHKPSGLLVHRSPLDPRARHFALQMTRDTIQRHVFPVHRLDRPVSGILLFAKTPEIAHKLIDAFASRAVDKTYLAVTRGYTDESGTIDHPIKKAPVRFEETQLRDPDTGKEAVTSYQRIATIELPNAVGRYQTSRYSLVIVTPKTGRRHQIRKHLKHINHPIIGDTIYGDGQHNRFAREFWHCHRILLAAMDLRFPHPVTNKSITLTAPLDPAYASVLNHLGWTRQLPEKWIAR